MPGDDGIRLDEHEALAPFRQEAGENDSQNPIRCSKPEPFPISPLQDNKLVAESQDFQLQGGSRSHRGCEPGEYRFQHIAHGSRQYQQGGCNAEIFNMIAQRFKRESPIGRSIFVSMANGSGNSGYIPNDAAFGYQTFEVLSSRCKPGYAESAIVNGILDLIEAAKQIH